MIRETNSLQSVLSVIKPEYVQLLPADDHDDAYVTFYSIQDNIVPFNMILNDCSFSPGQRAHIAIVLPSLSKDRYVRSSDSVFVYHSLTASLFTKTDLTFQLGYGFFSDPPYLMNIKGNKLDHISLVPYEMQSTSNHQLITSSHKILLYSHNQLPLDQFFYLCLSFINNTNKDVKLKSSQVSGSLRFCLKPFQTMRS